VSISLYIYIYIYIPHYNLINLGYIFHKLDLKLIKSHMNVYILWAQWRLNFFKHQDHKSTKPHTRIQTNNKINLFSFTHIHTHMHINFYYCLINKTKEMCENKLIGTKIERCKILFMIFSQCKISSHIKTCIFYKKVAIVIFKNYTNVFKFWSKFHQYPNFKEFFNNLGHMFLG